MNNIFRLLQYEYMVPILLAFVVMVIISQILASWRGGEGYLKLYISRSFLLLYLCVFIVVTQLLISKPTEWGIAFSPNVIPFKLLLQNYQYHGLSAFAQYFLNIVMCIPLGILLPLSFPKRKWSYGKAVVIAVLVPLATEVVQFFTGRIADVDDLTANALGIVAGFGFIMTLWHFSRQKRFRLKSKWLIFISVLCTIAVGLVVGYIIYWCGLALYTGIMMK